LIITDEEDEAEDGGGDSDEMSDAQGISLIPAALDLWSPQSCAEIRRVINEGKALPRWRNPGQKTKKNNKKTRPAHREDILEEEDGDNGLSPEIQRVDKVVFVALHAKAERFVRWNEFMIQNNVNFERVLQSSTGLSIFSPDYWEIRRMLLEVRTTWKTRALNNIESQVKSFVGQFPQYDVDGFDPSFGQGLDKHYTEQWWVSSFDYMKGHLDLENSTPLGKFFAKSKP
jgi:hypothetical protein